jgi:hypothetical protein
MRGASWALRLELHTPPLPATHVKVETGRRTLAWLARCKSRANTQIVRLRVALVTYSGGRVGVAKLWR